MLPDFPNDARIRIYTNDPLDVAVTCQYRVLPRSPCEFLVEIIARGIILWGADISVSLGRFGKGLRQAFQEDVQEAIEAAGVALKDGLSLSVEPFWSSDIVTEYDKNNPGVAGKVLFACHETLCVAEAVVRNGFLDLCLVMRLDLNDMFGYFWGLTAAFPCSAPARKATAALY